MRITLRSFSKPPNGGGHWAWLYEILEPHLGNKNIVLADAFKTRILVLDAD